MSTPNGGGAGFDPDGPGRVNGGIFGLPFSVEEADIVIVPVPWEVTVSYRAGTAQGPATILAASPQLDLYDEGAGEFWKVGIALAEENPVIQQLNAGFRPWAVELIHFLEHGGQMAQHPALAERLAELNAAGATLNGIVQETVAGWLDRGKQVILLGGDHSTPLGYLRALAERHPEFGILQIDAHLDLREAYGGFTYSHASIMHHALGLPQVTHLVPVGVRDFCRAEADRVRAEGERVRCFTGRELARAAFSGKTWAGQCVEIIADLPQKVYISFDVDGLAPHLCPHTGTPVPGGLEFEAALYLLAAVASSGREIIGMDLVEVAPGPGGDEWDAIVGARLLYRMAALLAGQVRA